jgi:hypothetical protein
MGGIYPSDLKMPDSEPPILSHFIVKELGKDYTEST